ncbi:MAG: vitamin B12-dependent ribonucleotide reductase, partial [Candidatus Kerfeldbacteria bacterium]|nr:vitamin B12-dependent ribonucleotide reductase [Candidatus Kerfeldbacteria bacterium]
MTPSSVTAPTATREAAAGLRIKTGTFERLPNRQGLTLKRFFTKASIDPYDELEWEQRDAVIQGGDGNVVFEQRGVEIPKTWTQLATNVVVSKYFRGPLGTPRRETSVRQMVSRVSMTISEWGRAQGYFATDKDAEVFEVELRHLLVNQKMAFNSPVWFNVGVEEVPQCSACFILKVEDSMESILEWYRQEGMIFKGGSGSGINLSTLRSSRERLSAGGEASGPVSFMRGADASAGAIKSGGKTRRAAKMVVLNAAHPDIEEFIQCKVVEEQKAWALGEAGYDMSLNGEAWKSIQFQNANNSVRATDEFMEAVERDGDWWTKAVTTGEKLKKYRAKELMRKIAEAAWTSGDPGMQFDTTANDWNTVAHTDRINASNPCSEYMHVDNSACNLASINLMKFLGDDGSFDVAGYKRAIDLTILAQEIIVGNSSYPTEQITVNAKKFRELGLGYSNLGGLLMRQGVPYDSDTGRAWGACLTAILTGEAYAESARVAEHMGPFDGYAENAEPMLRVIRKHREALEGVDRELVPSDVFQGAQESWHEALARGGSVGVRNSQASVIAPTGTISFLMDCDTTGIEPDIALVKYKTLVGGGLMKMVNRVVPTALETLGYDETEIKDILAYIEHKDTIEGAPHLKDEHLPVFDCAFKPTNGKRSIHYMGHVRMMAATQPFVSGAISKTVNLPSEATVEDVMQAYLDAWKMGLKAIAVYRDGSKKTQPLGTRKDSANAKAVAQDAVVTRKRLPDERKSITHKFSIAGHEGYITVGMYEDGAPGELFVTMSKAGSTINGLMDSLATSISIALQYGVPLSLFVKKFSHVRFEPSGYTTNEDIRIAKSIVDYIFRWLGTKFLPKEASPGQMALPAISKPPAAISQDVSNGEAEPLNGNGLNGSIETENRDPFAAAPVPTADSRQPTAASRAADHAAFENMADAPACSD